MVAAGPGETASDLLQRQAGAYALNSEDVHQLLVVDRGWEVGQWRNWVEATLAAQLLE